MHTPAPHRDSRRNAGWPEHHSLVDGFRHVPLAAHARREGHQVSRLDLNPLAAPGGSHHHPALEHVCGFGAVVAPGELADPAAPGGPALDAQLLKKAGRGGRGGCCFGERKGGKGSTA